MNTTSTTDYGALLKDTFTLGVKPENLVPLLVDSLIVSVGSACTLGLCAPALVFGYTQMAQRVVRGEKVNLGDSLQGFQHFVPSALLGLLLFASFFFGLFIGGLVLMFVCTYAFHLLVLRPHTGTVEAVSGSFALVRDNIMDTLVLWAFGTVVGTLLAPTFLGSVAVFAFCTLLSAVLFSRLANNTAVMTVTSR